MKTPPVMNKIIRANLGSQVIRFEAVPPEYTYLGGRALTSRIVSEEVDPASDVMGPDNRVIYAPGLLGGLNASSVNRLSIGGKSPLTRGIKESNSGGNFASALANLGIKAVILEGKAEVGKMFVLKIGKNDASLEKADDLQGLTASSCAERIRARWGEKKAFSLIGPAAERKLRAAAIINTDQEGIPARYCARGGLAAVIASKGIKAVIVDHDPGTQTEVNDVPRYRSALKAYTKALSNDATTQDVYKKYGTAAMIELCNELGGLPTRNFSDGRFEGFAQIGGKTLRDTILARGGNPSHACMRGCIIKSSNIYCDRNGREIVRSLEYETIALFGSNCGLSSLDEIAEINRFCNEFGLDCIEIGVAIGIAMEDGIVPFGDFKGVRKLLQAIEADFVLGRVLGNGAAITGTVLGVRRVPAVKGQAMAAYDPRAIKGIGVTYATSPMGADHTAGMNVRSHLDQRCPEGHVASIREEQLLSMVLDSMGLCLFTHPVVRRNPELVVELLNSARGWNLERDDLWGMARKTLRIEIDYNRACGISALEDALPAEFRNEKLPSSGTVFDVPQEQQRLLTEWW